MRRFCFSASAIAAVLLAAPAGWAQEQQVQTAAVAESESQRGEGVARLALVEDQQPADTRNHLLDDGIETIRERYPNGSIKVERHVKQDADENYITHGIWKMWDQTGRLISQGTYENGVRSGEWVRSYRQGEAERLAGSPFNQFTPPFVSRANFKNDKLDGVWTIVDARKRQVTEWEFKEGLRHGTLTWWYPSGEKMQQIEYRNGVIDGKLQQWTDSGKQIADVTYTDGRRIDVKESKYKDGTVKAQGTYLLGKEALVSNDQWWTLTSAVYKVEGEDERHGEWTSFHPNGNKKLQGRYEHGIPVGVFTWWHPNGQKATHGEFQLGKQHGKWTWWHANGMKAVRAEFNAGVQAGSWTWWKQDGMVAQKASFGAGGTPLQVPTEAPQLADSGDAQLQRVDAPSILEPEVEEKPASSRRTAKLPAVEPNRLR